MSAKKSLTWVLRTALLLGMGLLVAACAQAASPAAPTTPTTEAAPPGPTSPPEPAGDPVRGGLLYDTWWAVPKSEEAMEAEAHEVEGPETDHPLWASQTTNTRSGSETWRCKECHGWDYLGAGGAYGSGSHLTGFPGIFAVQDLPTDEVVAILKGSTNPDHDFSGVMEAQDLTDLALFITQTLIDDAALVDADGSSTGEATLGQDRFEEVCILCHGPDGNAINFASLEEPEFLGHVAADNPWEFLHKVRFGQPGWPMPSGIRNEWTDDDFANVLAYAQTLPTTSAVSGGGPLYDMWWEAIGAEAPEGDQPLWATQTTNTRSGEDTWRCKECHGWDYLGADGAYGSGSHLTGFPGVLAAASQSVEDLTAWLTGGQNPDHDFSPYLSEVQVAAVVAFLRDETFDSAAYINPDGTVNGDPARGKVKFEKTCAACHGLDGTEMNFGSAEEPEYVGTVAADNPWEFLHKDAFGQPGAPMPAGWGLGYTLEDLANLLAYAQTLPTK
jgi:thiosulfate dehydrogenase